MWGSPILKKPSKEKKEAKEPLVELPKFKKEPLILSKAGAKKLLNTRQEVSEAQIAWVQRWLETRMRERSLPPQIVSKDAYGKLMEFLSPIDALSTLENLRDDFRKAHPDEITKGDDFAFLTSLEELKDIHLTLPEPE